jgi:DEAD/DEAH box helicase domain-containing protein
MDRIVVDVEIEKTIEETPGGWDATDKLGVAVACVWEETLAADRIDGFNTFNFDFPVIWGISKSSWRDLRTDHNRKRSLYLSLEGKSNDLLRRIWQSRDLDPDVFDPVTHGGYSLDAVAGATLNAAKIGHGADAPKWYQEGLIQKVANYCADDVAIERDLADFVDRYGNVVNPKTMKKLPLVDWSF